jgi:hypothetical protein
MKKTVLCHFYNEEFLLPFWLKHHRKMFDHGIMIDYNSNDNSVSIIKEICPNWKILSSRNQFFDARQVDLEIIDLEKNLDGWRIALNVTEFLVGEMEKLEFINDDIYIPSLIMVCDEDLENKLPDPDFPLCLQHTKGIFPQDETYERFRLRRMSRESKSYPIGRHFLFSEHKSDPEFLILWYKYAPFTKQMIKRALQIQHRMPETDKKLGFGYNHLISSQKYIQNFKKYQMESLNMLHYYRHQIEFNY